MKKDILQRMLEVERILSSTYDKKEQKRLKLKLSNYKKILKKIKEN